MTAPGLANPGHGVVHCRSISHRVADNSAPRAAWRLVTRGAVEITQGGRVVDPSTAKGAIRIRRR